MEGGAAAHGIKTEEDEGLRRRRRKGRRKRSAHEEHTKYGERGFRHVLGIDGATKVVVQERSLRLSHMHTNEKRQVESSSGEDSSAATSAVDTGDLSSAIEDVFESFTGTSTSDQTVLTTPPPAPASSLPSSLAHPTPIITTPSFMNDTIVSMTPQTFGSTTTLTSLLEPVISVTTSDKSTITRTYTDLTESRSTIGNTVIYFTYPTANVTSVTKTSTASPTQFASEPTFVPGGIGIGGPGDSSPAPGPAPSTVPSPSDTPAPSPAPSHPKIIGGVIGGLAGIAVIAAILLFMIKRHKRNALIQAQVDAGYGGPAMSEHRSSFTPFAAAAGFLGRNSRYSRSTAPSEPIPEERGFYKLSGRKLAPVLGGPRPESSVHDGAPTETFFHHHGEDGKWAGPPGSPASGRMAPPPPIPRMPDQFSERLSERYSERTSSPQLHPPSIHSQSRTSSPRPGFGGLAGRDALGRSHASHDGSRTSRFTEDIV